MADERRQSASVARRADDSVRLQSTSVDEHDVATFEALHLCHDLSVSALQRRDEAVIDGWVAVVVAVIGVQT
ncbi:MAG TPA: hypothetical protein VMU65_16425, partial [Candidatus Saccharimonadales bacterium]|nr:hypothetical protein [Candidatus Saccharimonadales bacterium]